MTKKVVYEKVTEAIFDLRDDLENGVLYFPRIDSGYEKIKNDKRLGELYGFQCDNWYIVRKKEVVIDWVEEVCNYVNKLPETYGIKLKDATNTGNYRDRYISFDKNTLKGDEFLEMCRIALRATGELK
jgi:hypothetical protein